MGIYNTAGNLLTGANSATHYSVPSVAQPGVWFIDRTYYFANMTNSPNAGNTDTVGDVGPGLGDWFRGTCPIGNRSRMRGIHCDQN